MGEKVKSGQYRSLQEMRDDCELMSKNALLFNRAPGEVSTMTRDGIKSWSRRCKRYACSLLLLNKKYYIVR